MKSRWPNWHRSTCILILGFSLGTTHGIALAQDTQGSPSAPATASSSATSAATPTASSTPATNQATTTTTTSGASSNAATSQQPTVKVNSVAVEIAPLKISFELDGVLDAPNKAQFILRPKALKEMKLMGVLQHGAKVSQGQVILQLDAEAYERAKRTAEQAAVSAELDHRQASLAMASLEESLRIELEASELANKRAQEELEYYVSIGRAKQEEDLKISVEYSAQNVEYVQEEYDQLKKMYDADELTEESEEIVLKRALNNLNRAKRGFENTKRSVERQLKFDLDRQEAGLKNAAAKAKLDLERLQKSKEGKLSATKLLLAKAEVGLELAKKELANLNEDRQLLAAVSPFAGVVFWGAVTNQGWKSPASPEELQTIGGSLAPNRALLTVVSSEKIFVRANLNEKQLPLIRPGAVAVFEPTAKPDVRLQLVCEERSDIPTEPGMYRANFRINSPADLENLLPLMSGKISGVSYEKEKALLIPIDAVRYENSISYVQIHDPVSGNTSRQNVQLGKRDGKKVEVNQGLREGEYVVVP